MKKTLVLASLLAAAGQAQVRHAEEDQGQRQRHHGRA